MWLDGSDVSQSALSLCLLEASLLVLILGSALASQSVSPVRTALLQAGSPPIPQS